MSSTIYNEIARKIGKEFAKNYRESAPFFNARIETGIKKGYFLESIQFVDSKGNKAKREYKLKCIGESSIQSVLEFKNEYQARKFFDSMVFLESGALVLEKSNTTAIQFYSKLNAFQYERLYNDGYTCCFWLWYKNEFHSFCEGDQTILHCATDKIVKNERNSQFKYFKEL